MCRDLPMSLAQTWKRGMVAKTGRPPAETKMVWQLALADQTQLGVCKMNRNGDLIHPMTFQETLTSAKHDEHIPPHTPQRVESLGSQGTPVYEELRPGNNSIDRLLTVAEVAARLNVPRKWVYRRVVLKPPVGIPHVKMGKYLRFRESDIRNYVERLRRN